jgi:hypothetical protein
VTDSVRPEFSVLEAHKEMIIERGSVLAKASEVRINDVPLAISFGESQMKFA